MKEINLYITEKFKISKDIKSNYDSDKITELIAKIFLVEKNQKVIKYINDWVIDNDIQLIEVFYQKSDPKTKDIVKVRDENYISSNTEASFGVFLKYFNEYFGKTGEKQNDYKLYDTNNTALYGNSKALSYLTLKYNFIILKKETI